MRIRKERLTRGFFIEVATNALLIALPADLLYLYYSGLWYDPIKALEVTEVVILYLVILFAFWRHYQFIIRIRKGWSRCGE